MFRTLVFLFSCFFILHLRAQTAKINFEKEGYVKAVITEYKVENCGFMIQLADKKKTKLLPMGLSEEFKKNKLKVWVKYTLPKKQPATTCMAGEVCELLDIKRRK